MIKLIYCLHRLSHLSLEEFQGHWLEHHSQFGRRVSGIRRYVQYHTLANDPIREAMLQAGASSVEPYDGIAIAWWDDIEALRTELTGNPNVAKALEDEKHFIDHDRSVAFLAHEQVIVEPEGQIPYVLIECLRRNPAIDRQEYQKRWLEHAHIGHKARAMGLLMGYIQNHTLLDGATAGLEGLGANPDVFDGVTTAYFESIAKFKALVASPLATEESYEDEKTFIDHSQSANMLTRRHVIKDMIR